MNERSRLCYDSLEIQNLKVIGRDSRRQEGSHREYLYSLWLKAEALVLPDRSHRTDIRLVGNQTRRACHVHVTGGALGWLATRLDVHGYLVEQSCQPD